MGQECINLRGGGAVLTLGRAGGVPVLLVESSSCGHSYEDCGDQILPVVFPCLNLGKLQNCRYGTRSVSC